MLNNRRPDIWLFISAIGLTGFGILMVYSVQAAKGSEVYYLKRHLLWVTIGIASMVVVIKIGVEKLRAMAYPVFAVSLVLLALVFVPSIGVKVNGAQRWLSIGALRFQPSELVKLTLIIMLARYLSETERQGWDVKRFALPLGCIVLVQAILLLQPDFGGALMIGAIGLLMLFVAGAPLRYFIPVVSAVGLTGVWLIVQAPYRLQRILAFVDPWKDPRGEGFQLIQSLVALGRGGLTGVGIGNSQQKLQFLPEVRTDFIFAIVGEEMGLIGTVLVLSLFFLLLWRGYRAMVNCAGPFCRYLVFGLVMSIEIQAVINMAVVTGLLPTKGLPLPFISYGGSATVINLMTVGILLWLSRGEPEMLYSERQRILKSIARRRLRREGLL